MAEEAKKRRIIKKAETVRELTAKQANAKPKNKGVLGLTWHYVTLPFRVVGRVLKKILRVITPKYFRESWHELRQVTWPDRKNTAKLTLAVIIFAIVFGALVTVVDFFLSKLFKEVILS